MPQQDKQSGHSTLAEHDIIARYFRPLAEGVPGAYGLVDDAASLSVGSGEDLVVTTDALVAGVHFFADDAPADIAWKTLAVNVSDLAAKAAAPLAYSLALVLPRNTAESWIAGFAQGLAEAQEAFGIGLSGGDTAVSPAGPLTISVTAFGTVPRLRMVRRKGAKAGDALYASGTIGDAVLGLRLRSGDTEAANWPLDDAGRKFLTARYLRPAPRIALRDALLAHASAAMDISDGLAIDASRLCAASGVRIHIDASAVPLSRSAQKLRNAEAVSLVTLISGGDDYEILAAIPPASEQAFAADAASREVPVTRIGRIAEGAGLDIRDATGTPLALDRLGYDHFRG
jgi:thiamine-monophosphate kinase